MMDLRNYTNNLKPINRQSGAALLILVFLMALVITTYVLKTLNAVNQQQNQDKKTQQTLNEAKQALIAWSVAHQEQPGQLPFPDRNADGNYDGISDCNSPLSTFVYTFLIGQLPIYGQENPCTSPHYGVGGNFTDAQGNRLWVAVSRNLIHKYDLPTADPTINPSIIDAPVYPWLKVRDRNGSIISDHVAAVIIAPGGVLSGQNRTGIASANQYLDAFQIGATTFSNADYDTADEDFIIGQDSRLVNNADTSVVRPYNFNDKLVFITVDELMTALTARASNEAASLLKQYKTKNGQLSYAADLGASFGNHNASGVSNKGMLPIDVTDTCGCSSDTACTCSFKPITSVTMQRNSGTWNTAQDVGACSSAVSAPSNKCVCTGQGSCTRFATSFTCDTDGACMHTLVPSINNKFTYKFPSHADAFTAELGCVKTGDDVVCNNTGSFTIGLKEPAWFKNNRWQDFYYYEWSPGSNLTVGTKVGVESILVQTGKTLVSDIGQVQTRPSSDIRDYLDSTQNTDNDDIFDAMQKQKTSTYNDQPFIVSP